ncbi:hypothetical protein F5X99DRAFT_405426 [Biscogniauxia marginata]|nr:hypothetical protein F5X99DRAFT_405426 [Biscogniauxia marginata]
MSGTEITECTACFENKHLSEFQQTTITSRCTHPSTLCIDCVNSSIISQTQNGFLSQLACPECPERLNFEEVQRFTNSEIFTKYHALTVEQLISKVHNFAWCPLGCGTGQVHDIGSKQPLVLCLTCKRQFCFRHRVTWHHDHTCDEYDAFLADPQDFRSKAQIAAALSESRALEEQKLLQGIQDADANFAQSLLNEGEAAKARVRAKLERIEQERRAREQAAREEEQRRREQEALQEAARLREEENATSQVFQSLTKPCPSCRRPIQKNGGCDHIHCLPPVGCGYHFYWSGAGW